MKKILLAILFCLVSSLAWATYPNYTICSSGCDYNNLNAALSDVTTNHNTFSQNVTITATSGFTDTTAVVLAHYSPGAYTLTITATGTARHNGVYNSSFYTLSPSSGTPFSIQYNNDNSNALIIDGIQIVEQGSATNGVIDSEDYDGGFTFRNLIIVPNSSEFSCINDNNPRQTSYFYNNICYGLQSQYGDFFGEQYSSGSGDGNTHIYVYNNTLYNFSGSNSVGIKAIPGCSSFIASNNAVLNIGEYSYSGTFSSGATNAASDTTATTSPLTRGINNLTSYSSYFSSPSGKNFNLISGSSLIGVGTNLYSTFTTDITGATRQSSGAWDIGAFKYSGSAPVNHGFTRFL